MAAFVFHGPGVVLATASTAVALTSGELKAGLHPLPQPGLARGRGPPASAVLESPGRGPPRPGTNATKKKAPTARGWARSGPRDSGERLTAPWKTGD
jgi:hypothetical protein